MLHKNKISRFRRVDVANPAPGSPVLSTTVPANKNWRIIWAFVRLTADGNAANRNISLTVHTPGFDQGYLVTSDNSNHVANSNDVITFMPGGGYAGVISPAHYVAPLPVDMWIPESNPISILVFNTQVGDQVDDFTILIEEVDVTP